MFIGWNRIKHSLVNKIYFSFGKKAIFLTIITTNPYFTRFFRCFKKIKYFSSVNC